MKTIILTFSFIMSNFIGFSIPKTDSIIRSSDFSGSFDLLKIKVSNLIVLKEKSNSRNLDSHTIHMRRKLIKPLLYLCFNITEKKVLFRNRDYFTNIGFFISSNISDSSAYFEYFTKSGKTYKVELTSNRNNTLNLFITETKKNGKRKTYLSKNCGFEKVSV